MKSLLKSFPTKAIDKKLSLFSYRRYNSARSCEKRRYCQILYIVKPDRHPRSQGSECGVAVSRGRAFSREWFGELTINFAWRDEAV